MAKQPGILKITGTVHNLCFYKLAGEFYARSKSSLSGRRVKKDPAFAETMKYATMMAKASVIASGIYSTLPSDKKSRSVYQQLTGRVIKMLRQGIPEDQILRDLKIGT
jgi:hypothetical protein